MIIDKAKAIELLEQAVAEKGADYTYPGAHDGDCRYAEYDGAYKPVCPSCMIGYAYAYAGATLQQLAALDDRSRPSMASILYRDDLDVLPVATTPEAAVIFREAQQKQDVGRSWGEALEAAKAAAA